jgi:glyoxylase-like metal-dependent hydrolase (beta-lactamase superfamily II)
MKTIPYDSNLTVFEGGGGNAIVLTSEDGTQALVVDTKMGNSAKTLAASVKAKDITIVNTHCHRDHIGGNNLFPKATIIAGAYTQEQWKAMAPTCKFPDKVVNPGEEVVLKIGSETAHVRNMGKAHSWNDVVVFLENRKFLITGDIVFKHQHPALFAQGGANAASWILVIDSLISRYDPKAVLPGHGAMSDKSALSDQKGYFVSIMAAIGSPEKLSAIKEKYKDYAGIPMLADFNRTVKFLETEKKGD